MQVVRLATVGDSDTVFALVQDAVAAMQRNGIEQWDEVYPSRTTIASDIDRGAMYLVEAAGRIAGMIVVDAQQAKEYADVPWRYSGHVSVVHRLTVHPTCQRQGVASRLMRFAETEVAARGYEVIRLDAYEGNRGALSLYKRLGYRSAGQVRFRKGMFRCFEKRVGAHSTA